MLKRILKLNLLLVIVLFTTTNTINAISVNDSITRTEFLKPFDWDIISGIEKLVVSDGMSKSNVKKLNAGNTLYLSGIDKMEGGNYEEAIEIFKETIKKYYKRAKVTPESLDAVYLNIALCYANTGKQEHKVIAERNLGFLTSKVDKDKNISYNMGIAYHLIGEKNAATSHLGQAIRLDENYFQAYITLEAIYRNNNQKEEADRIRDRMETAEAKLIKKSQKNKGKNKSNKKDKSNTTIVLEGVKPEVTKLNYIKTEDHFKFNKSIEKDRSADMVQEGERAYEEGVSSLKNGDYEEAITSLKIAEKKLKRGKVNIHGLNYSRANLIIANLCVAESTGEKSTLGQAKRGLKYLTNKLYNTREWTYNIAVANYSYGVRVLRGEVGSEKWLAKAKSSAYIKQSIKLLKLTYKFDKLYLPAYQNLVYIYNQLGDDKKAEKYQKIMEKRREQLLRSLDREEQIKMGIDGEYVFRINLGVFGEYEAPADMFDEPYLITVPINERNTTYFSGMFYNINDAKEYMNGMIEKGYTNCKIIPYRDGDEIDL